MAIDGTQIIDSDLAHDIYNEFMDLYDANAPIATIRKEIESWRSELSDDLEREIFLSVYCQALWEIGELAHGEVAELESEVRSERGLRIWQGLGDDLYHERRKVLARQLSKLSEPKAKIRSRKKYKKIENFLFEVGNCLIYKHDNGNESPLLVCDISQHRNECLYSMTPLVIKNQTEPTIQDFRNGQFIGHKIASTFASSGFYYGFTVARPEHRELIKYADCFTKIDSLKIDPEKAELGSWGGILTKEDFEKEIVRIVKTRKVFQHELFPLSEVIY